MLDLIRNSQEYPLDTGAYCDFLGDDGFGAAPVQRLSSRGPQQHGETAAGFRLLARMPTLLLGIEGSSLSDLYAKRATLIGLFGPSDPITLRWTIGSTVKQIDAYLYRDLSMPSRGRKGFYQEVAVTLICPDPTFYDPVVQSVTFGLGGGSGSFVVPMPVPHGVGVSTLDDTAGVDYPGSWLSYPFVRITGPVTSPVLTNLTTNEKLDFTGTTISAGDYYEIDCRYGHKTVIDSNSNNKIDKLTSDSDLATFHIRHDSADAPGGSNGLKVTGTAITTATNVYVSYYVRYIGL